MGLDAGRQLWMETVQNVFDRECRIMRSSRFRTRLLQLLHSTHQNHQADLQVNSVPWRTMELQSTLRHRLETSPHRRLSRSTVLSTIVCISLQRSSLPPYLCCYFAFQAHENEILCSRGWGGGVPRNRQLPLRPRLTGQFDKSQACRGGRTLKAAADRL